LPCTLAATHYDPDGRMNDQIARMLPVLTEIFDGLAIQSAHASPPAALEMLRAAGATVQQEETARFNGLAELGGARREVVRLGLQLPADTILFCDFDRALHWAEYHPDELRAIASELAAHDFTVLGRTARAFASHPAVQCHTELIINNVFARCGGKTWDITAAARGMSRRAAEAILAGCPEASIGTDMAWPLFLLKGGDLSVAYRETEGLEFETADRFPDEIAAAGGREQWLDQLDDDPAQWSFRLDLARIEVAAAEPYAQRP
jgi:hypothetical protein